MGHKLRKSSKSFRAEDSDGYISQVERIHNKSKLRKASAPIVKRKSILKKSPRRSCGPSANRGEGLTETEKLNFSLKEGK